LFVKSIDHEVKIQEFTVLSGYRVRRLEKGKGTGWRKGLLDRLEAKFLQQEPVAFLFDKKSGPIVAITGLENPYAEFQATVLAFVPDQKITDDIGVEKIANDHLRLAFAVSIAFFRKSDINPCVEITG